jgi:hypothetical protein
MRIAIDFIIVTALLEKEKKSQVSKNPYPFSCLIKLLVNRRILIGMDIKITEIVSFISI